MCRYSNRYTKIIDYYVNNPTEGFVEKHHILPKCLGGDDHHTNIVLLPPKAHLICHYLLYKMYPENRKIAHAYAMMGVNNQNQNRIMFGRIYEESKRARSNALKGIPRPEWVKEKLRKPKSNTENYYGNTNAKGNKGKTIVRSKEHQKNLTNALKPYWEEKKRKTAEKNKDLIELYKQSSMSQRKFSEKYKIDRKYLFGVKRNNS